MFSKKIAPTSTLKVAICNFALATVALTVHMVRILLAVLLLDSSLDTTVSRYQKVTRQAGQARVSRMLY